MGCHHQNLHIPFGKPAGTPYHHQYEQPSDHANNAQLK